MSNKIKDFTEKAATEEEVEIRREILDTTFIPSRYNHVKKHNGFRPNTLSGLIAPTGIGKSSLTKTYVIELAKVCPVLLWISEETKTEYQELISTLDKGILDNITFVDEKKIDSSIKENQELFFKTFIDQYSISKAKYIVIDNITTSPFYSSRFGIRGQEKTTDFFRAFVKKHCSIFWVAHTRSEIGVNYGKALVAEDIKQSKELALNTEYLYGMQRFTSGNEIYNVLQVLKARHHNDAVGWYFMAFAKGSYVGDGELSFEQVNTIFKNRDYLGKRMTKPKDDDFDAPKKKDKNNENNNQQSLGID